MNESLTEILKLLLSADPSVQQDPPTTIADKMMRVLLVKAMQGDVEAIREVWDRVEPSEPDAYYMPVSSQPQCEPMSWDLIPPPASATKSFEELREAGGKAWDEIEDPEVYLKETTG